VTAATRASSRKVRTPQGRTLREEAAKADGKWHRKQTARVAISGGDAGKGETVG
jgi:hypothetical protein